MDTVHKKKKKKKDPRDLGRHSLVLELRYMNTKDSFGMGLDHACILHYDGVLLDCDCMNYIHGRLYMEH